MKTAQLTGNWRPSHIVRQNLFTRQDLIIIQVEERVERTNWRGKSITEYVWRNAKPNDMIWVERQWKLKRELSSVKFGTTPEVASQGHFQEYKSNGPALPVSKDIRDSQLN